MNKYISNFILVTIIFSIYFFTIEYLSEFISPFFYLNLIPSMIISIIVTTTVAGMMLFAIPAIKKDPFGLLVIFTSIFIFGKYLELFKTELSKTTVYIPHIELSSPVNLLILLMSLLLGLIVSYKTSYNIQNKIIKYIVHFSYIIIISSILIFSTLNFMKLTNIIIEWISYTLNLNSILSTVLLIVLLCMCIGFTIFILVFFTKMGDNDIIMSLMLLLTVTTPIFLTGSILNVISYILQKYSISSMLILSSMEGKNRIPEVIAPEVIVHDTLTTFISTMIISVIIEILYIFTKDKKC